MHAMATGIGIGVARVAVEDFGDGCCATMGRISSRQCDTETQDCVNGHGSINLTAVVVPGFVGQSI